MKAKIDEYGVFWLERDGKLKEQICPFQSQQQGVSCGDMCPHFENYMDTYQDQKSVISLTCGRGRDWYLDELIDERRY